MWDVFTYPFPIFNGATLSMINTILSLCTRFYQQAQRCHAYLYNQIMISSFHMFSGEFSNDVNRTWVECRMYTICCNELTHGFALRFNFCSVMIFIHVHSRDLFYPCSAVFLQCHWGNLRIVSVPCTTLQLWWIVIKCTLANACLLYVCWFWVIKYDRFGLKTFGV